MTETIKTQIITEWTETAAALKTGKDVFTADLSPALETGLIEAALADAGWTDLLALNAALLEEIAAMDTETACQTDQTPDQTAETPAADDGAEPMTRDELDEMMAYSAFYSYCN
jgi:hypothetical protein